MLRAVIFFLLFLPTIVFADTSRGEKLLNCLWKDMKEGNIDHIKAHTSKEFKAIHVFGASNRFQELEIIQNLHIQAYTLSEIKITQGDDIIVATYRVTKVDGGPGFPINGPRLSVWKKFGKEWKWVAHANLFFQEPE